MIQEVYIPAICLSNREICRVYYLVSRTVVSGSNLLGDDFLLKMSPYLFLAVTVRETFLFVELTNYCLEL